MSDDFYCDFVLSGVTEVERLHESENVLAFLHTKPFWEITCGGHSKTACNVAIDSQT